MTETHYVPCENSGRKGGFELDDGIDEGREPRPYRICPACSGSGEVEEQSDGASTGENG